MGHVINTNSPGKRRNHQMRTAAEILRHLSQKKEVDDDVKNMVAMLVFCFREIGDGIDQSTAAWEKRDYWLKADAFRQRWLWVHRAAEEIQNMVKKDNWETLPIILINLIPHFSSITISKFTRNESMWQGSYARLIAEQSRNQQP